MKRRYVVTLGELEQKLRPQMAAIRSSGLNPEGLVTYGLMAATESVDYHSMVSYLIKDMMDANPGLMEDPRHYNRVLHTCLDFIGEAARHIAPNVERAVGVPCDHRVRFEEYLGDNDAVISVVT